LALPVWPQAANPGLAIVKSHHGQEGVSAMYDRLLVAVDHSETAGRVVNAARADDASIIVMGSRGRSDLTSLI
jgi:nucleotide-binding universal stress UspA family protein